MRKFASGLLPVLLSIGLVAGIGCGGGSGKTPTDTTGPYVPLKVGNEWRYNVIETDGTITAKVQGVTAMGVVGGTGPAAAAMAYKLVTGDKFGDENGDVSYQNWENGRLVRYREISVGGSSGRTKKEEYYDGMYKLRVWDDTEHTTATTRWIEAYKTFTVDTPKTPDDAGAPNADGGATVADAGLVTTDEMTTEVWTVVAVDESVTVPAGTFKALVLERIIAANSSDKKFWFVRGVGKVKETGVGDQTEELIKVTIMP